MQSTILGEVRTPRQPFPTWGDGYTLSARAQLVHYAGNASPHFSTTADVFSALGRDEGGGAMTVEIARLFPDLAPVTRVHLADHHGVPMHAEANAWHWLGYSTWGRDDTRPMPPDDDYGRRTLELHAVDGLVWAPDTLASHLRITVEEARQIKGYLADDPGNPREALRFCMRDLFPRWQADADAALDALGGDVRANLATWLEVAR